MKTLTIGQKMSNRGNVKELKLKHPLFAGKMVIVRRNFLQRIFRPWRTATIDEAVLFDVNLILDKVFEKVENNLL